jgi:predicted nucleic acid-binding protein
MITFQNLGNISTIYLSVVALAYLMMVELGSERIRKALFPFVVVLIIVFIIVAAASVYATYARLK